MIQAIPERGLFSLAFFAQLYQFERVTLITTAGSQEQICCRADTTQAEIKQYIFEHLTQEVLIADMEIICSNALMKDTDVLEDLQRNEGGFYEIKQKKKKAIDFKVTTVYGDTHTVTMLDSVSCNELKKYIYDNYTQQLEVQWMNLTYLDEVIPNSAHLWTLQNLDSNSTLKQEKARLRDLQHTLTVFPEQMDPVYCEKELALMPCGHKIGRDTMLGHLSYLTSEQSREFQIKCLFTKENQERCKAVWDLKLCKKVGVLTKKEFFQFEEGLSRNWAKVFTKKCPNCSQTVIKENQEEKWVQCPCCEGPDFCFKCLSPYNFNRECQVCVQMSGVLGNAQMDRVFKLVQNGVVKQIQTPRYRMCPHCREVIEHSEACKHMECSNCSKSFCWVCLSVVQDQQEAWPCGEYSEYCGRVAQRQQF